MAQMGQQELLALAKTQLSLSPKASLCSAVALYGGEEYNALLPRVASPIKRTGSKILTKTESLPKLPAPAFYNPAMGAAKPKTEALHTVFPPIDADVKTVLPYNAVASGSKARALPSLASDDEMDVDIDPMTTINKYRDAIPYIAPAGGADRNDANGDYHGRGRDTFQGPQARQDDIDKFLVQAGNAQQFDGDASIDKALDKLGLQSTHQLLPSLDIPLMPHYIALMFKNPSEDPACKTTLIVAPLALLTQWNQEGASFVLTGGPNSISHIGANGPKKIYTTTTLPDDPSASSPPEQTVLAVGGGAQLFPNKGGPYGVDEVTVGDVAREAVDEMQGAVDRSVGKTREVVGAVEDESFRIRGGQRSGNWIAKGYFPELNERRKKYPANVNLAPRSRKEVKHWS
ncbi:hypothetical protein B0H17DRAFT_1145106 [Mycena rosella]|uniref:Uncharacterized protein n=1 Tax=Mycena rosella TaxID=1033263 RepID=A0AAD7CS18_MYCRO|nr:hypothetical protein B0H17DRAFT_1145106 [Mycena rosella]